MRRLMIAPVLAAVLLAAACSSNSGTKRTVTVVNTVTSNHATSAAGATTTGSSIVVGSSGTGASGPASGTAGTTRSSGPASSSGSGTASGATGASGSTTPTTKTTATTRVTATTATSTTFKKVDPTAANCADLLSADDVKTQLGATIGTTTSLVRIGAGDNGAKKAIRCLYGSKDGGKTAPVRVRLTQYDTAAHAKKQLGIDLQSGGVTAVTVDGFPASLQLAAGGLVEMQYDTWTLTLAVSDGLASEAKLTSGLPKLAGQVLTQVLRS